MCSSELNVPVAIEPVGIVRDQDGLAISSRNRYLSPAGRATALALPRALRAGLAAAAGGPKAVLAAAQDALSAAATSDPPLTTDYLALAEPATFTPVPDGFSGRALLLAAVTVGKTRLIDNVGVELGAGGGQAP